MPYAPLAAGQLISVPSRLNVLAAATDIRAATLALAWLLHWSPVMLPIPGTSRLHHLEQNLAAAATTLLLEQLAALREGSEVAAISE